MARARTAVKSRTTPDTDAISFPVLAYTDALPRDDLRDIKRAPAQVSEHGKVAKYEFPRPRNADGHESRKPPPGVAMASSFDFRVTAPPDEVFPSSAGANGSPGGIPRIGVALGSPSMLDSRDNLPPPRFNTEIFSQDQVDQPPLPRKSSKWKKIGGLFKAKNALAMPMDEPKVPPKQHAPKHKGEQGNKPTRRGSTEEWPKIEVDSTAAPAGHNTSPQRSRKFSLSGKKSNKPQPPEKGEKSRLLEIDIPDVQMERYSVMFSQVMNKNQRPSLLARRSKTLDNLRVPNNQDFLAAKLPPVPQRRATSPARSSFTLFPTSQPSKAAQVLGTQNFSRGPSPLLRSNTLPIESPSKASMEQSRPTANVNAASPFESPVVPNVFASHCSTPRSSLDKPLPSIKPELQASQSRPRAASKLAVAQTAKETKETKAKEEVEPAPLFSKPPVLTPTVQVSESPRSSPSSRKEAKPSVPPVSTRRRSSSLAIPRTRAEPQADQNQTKPTPVLQKRPSQLPILQAPKPVHQERKSSLQAPRVHTRPPIQAPVKPQAALQPIQQKERTHPQDVSQRPQQPDARPPRPNLRIQTKQQSQPRPPAKSGSSSSTLLSSTPPTSTLPTPSLSKDNLHRTPSPIIRSLSPQPGISPGGSSPRMPFVSEPEEIEMELDMPQEPAEPVSKIPTIEVSIARSISVSRGKRQMLVPIAARVDHLHSNERFIERRPMTPRITDVSYGHKHAVSQELQIESL
ncbi:uncharacterized protein N7496_005547 [Penicillium cataractarum]|uniref:Uncharacterized protein n=1 Tax=Penicillium cataractarum TaxID=2100454 RepID=A0A9W9SGF4_9EURO|nr:uncharacterized protein N7496_005547 [Penicillium cataractarum]KAJ5378138.1 hypothetical protein N7496_005547 [Penicillium cataractarum]